MKFADNEQSHPSSESPAEHQRTLQAMKFFPQSEKLFGRCISEINQGALDKQAPTPNLSHLSIS